MEPTDEPVAGTSSGSDGGKIMPENYTEAALSDYYLFWEKLFKEAQRDMETWFRQPPNRDFSPATIMRRMAQIGGGNYLQDVKFLVSLAVERGYNLQKMKLSKAVQTKVDALVQKYGVQSKPLSENSVTLGRICLSFPSLTCTYMAKARHTIVDKQILLNHCNDYPPVMMHRAFAYLIPRSLSDDAKRTIIDAHCLHQAHESEIIGRFKCGGVKKPRDYISYCKRFIEEAMATSLVPDEFCCHFLKNFNVIDDHNEPAKPVAEAASKLITLTSSAL